LQTAASVASSSGDDWHFIVSGDLRNCGDLVMPTIAADAAKYHPAFYWHLGDLRAIYEIDEDHAGELNANGTLNVWDMETYTRAARDDFIRMQIEPFEKLQISFAIGIGNHETIAPMSREKFIEKFSPWLDSAVFRDQRLKDAGTSVAGREAEAIHAYYHWIDGGVDFIYLDNASDEQFDASQMAWLKERLDQDRANPGIHSIVVGMHKALPDSLSNAHSMSESAAGLQSGRSVYRKLEAIQREDHKQVYVLSSHSHFIMTDIYNAQFWRDHKVGIVPGILVGTAGAVRYRLPSPLPKTNGSAASCTQDPRAFCAQTDAYGYLLATVHPQGTIDFAFNEIDEKDVPAEVQAKFAPDTMRVCFQGNQQMAPTADTTQDLPDDPHPF